MSLEALSTAEVWKSQQQKTAKLKKQVCDKTIDILDIDPKVEIKKMIKSKNFQLLKWDKERYFDVKRMVYVHDYKLQDLKNEENIVSFQIEFSADNNKVFWLNYKNKTTTFTWDDLFKLLENIYPRPVYLTNNTWNLELSQSIGYKFMNN